VETSFDDIPIVKNAICGQEFGAHAGFQFMCYDMHDGIWKYCYMHRPGYYQCFDGQEWEHINWHEKDGTADNSFMTSVHTDGRWGTSASVKAENHQSDYQTSETTFDEPPNVRYACGYEYNFAAGTWFQCFDYTDNMWK